MQPAKTLQAARRSCVPGSKATRCPAGSLSSRQHEATLAARPCWIAVFFGLCAAALPPHHHHPKAVLRCRQSRCRAAPRLCPNHGGLGLSALFMFQHMSSHMLLAYTSRKARCAAAGPASVPALLNSRRDIGGTRPVPEHKTTPRLPALRDRRPHAFGSQTPPPPPAAQAHTTLVGLSASRIPSLLL